MTVNPVTLLMENLTADEAEELHLLSKRIQIDGIIPDSDLIEEWLKVVLPVLPALPTHHEQRMLVLSAVFPARASLSVTNHLLAIYGN